MGRRHADGDRRRLTDPQDAIAGIVDGYVADGVTPELPTARRLRGRMRAVRGVDDRQREVIKTASEAGYYEVPREATVTEVAAEFDLDSSTVVEHLQRAGRNLMAHHLDGA